MESLFLIDYPKYIFSNQKKEPQDFEALIFNN